MKFNLLDIARKVGSEIIRNVVPGGSLIISAANALLPSSNQLSDNATGSDIQKAIDSLPTEQRAKIIEKKFDIDETWIKESSSCLRAAIEADTKTPHTTRPKIALGAYRTVSFVLMAVVSSWVYSVVTGDKDMISAIMKGWPFILAIIGPFTTILFAYFGVLKNELKHKLNAAQGVKSSPNILSSIISLFK